MDDLRDVRGVGDRGALVLGRREPILGLCFSLERESRDQRDGDDCDGVSHGASPLEWDTVACERDESGDERTPAGGGYPGAVGVGVV
jgi:hypothetical protein